jgi:hypothetical protein
MRVSYIPLQSLTIDITRKTVKSMCKKKKKWYSSTTKIIEIRRESYERNVELFKSILLWRIVFLYQ